MHDSEMVLTPIGRVKSSLTLPSLNVERESGELRPNGKDLRAEHEKIKAMESVIELHDDQSKRLHGLEAFSHVVVIYWPHLIKEADRGIEKVHPMGNIEIPKQGVYATCSPARPNPVLISVVELVNRTGCRLTVKGFEAVNDTPVIDIKPFSPHYMHAEGLIIPEWMASASS